MTYWPDDPRNISCMLDLYNQKRDSNLVGLDRKLDFGSAFLFCINFYFYK